MKVGSVIRIFDTDSFQPKVKMIVVVGDSQGQLATIYINTELRPDDFLPALQGTQLPLPQDKCGFLDHDSFADCSDITERSKGKINEILQKEKKRLIGTIPQKIMDEIIRLISVSETIDKATKTKYDLL